jgi:Lipoprotein confined to pathogenic Mycobacterium
MASSGDREDEPMKDAFETLMKRPSLTAVEAEFLSMFTTIRERLKAEVGVADWVPDSEPIRGSACAGELSNLDGAGVRRYDAGMSPGNIPDARWGQALAIVTEVAGQHGFGEPQVIVNRPSDHEVSFRNTYDGELLFGTGANTILGGSTGCHLTEEAHQRGTYQTPETS